MSALIDAARAELERLDERRRILTMLLDAYDEPGQDVPSAGTNGGKPAAAVQPARVSQPKPAQADSTQAKAAKAAILQHLRAGPQSPRTLKSVTQLSDHRFRVAIRDLEAEGRIAGTGSTTERRFALTEPPA